MKFHIQFVITGLSTGGAQMMLHKLLSRIDRKKFFPEIISLTNIVDLVDKFQEIEVPVRILGMHQGVPDPRGIYQLARYFRRVRPHLVQTWMYHADLIGGLAAKLVGNIPVIWNIRHSNLEPHYNKKTTILTAKACAWLSRSLPTKIICCAEVAKQIHANIGYDSSRIVVIPNGFDFNAFEPCLKTRLEVRQELGIPQDSLIIGLVSRFHPQKDHKNFVRAAALLKDKIPNVYFVLCGDGITWNNNELVTWMETAGLRNSFFLLGRRTDIARITSSFDIAASSSCGEAFSNTIGEAMACGVPCAVTDVGDSALIVGNTGKVVPPRNPEALSQAWNELINLGNHGRLKLGYLARQRILQNFSLDSIVKQYEDLYLEILHQKYQSS
jgi:glycosyltransferase involved in cell wall biosynthesis